MPEATVGPPVSELSVGLTAEYRPSHIASTVGEHGRVRSLRAMGTGQRSSVLSRYVHNSTVHYSTLLYSSSALRRTSTTARTHGGLVNSQSQKHLGMHSMVVHTCTW